MPPDLWFWILGWLLTAIILIGNSFVIHLITTRRSLRTTTNWFVLSLAVADFALGATYIPLSAACKLDKSCANGVIRYAIMIFFNCTSMANLCTLTLDRYLAIVEPLRYAIFMSGKRIPLLICAAWVLPALFFLAPYLTLEFAATGRTNEFFEKCFWVYLSLVELCVCVALLFATTHIFLIARRHARKNAALIAQLKFNHRIQHSRVKSQEMASTRVIGVVVAVFVFCYFLDIFDNACYLVMCKLNFALLDVVSLLMLTNSAVNPVAYAFFKKDIKTELKRLLRCTVGNRLYI